MKPDSGIHAAVRMLVCKLHRRARRILLRADVYHHHVRHMRAANHLRAIGVKARKLHVGVGIDKMRLLRWFL